MAGWQPEQLAAAIGVLVAAIAANAVLLAKSYAQVVNILEAVHRAGIPVRGAKGKGGGGVSNGVGIRQGTSAVRSLLAMEPVNQLAGVTVSSAVAPTGPVDCGPACVVSTIEEVKGCWSADELLRLRYFGTVDNRLTTADDLVGMLRANGIDAHARKGLDANTARQEILRSWQAGHPSLILGEWVARGMGHWVKFVGDRQGPVVMNPYPNTNSPRSWGEFESGFWGDYVHINGELSHAA